MMKSAFLAVVAALTAAHVRADEPSPIVPFVIPSGKPTESEVRNLVKTLDEHGFGQFLIYPSSGLEYPYLGEEFFRMDAAFLDEAKRRGMNVWLYDEFNWPSGTAKGRVPSENEDWLYKELVAVTNGAGGLSWQVVASREMNVDNYCLDGNNFESGSVARFMELTHEEYLKRFREHFGTTIRGFFSDEPGHCSGAWRMKMPPGTVLRVPYWSTMEADYAAASGGRDFRADCAAARRGDGRKMADVFRVWTEIRSRRYRKTFFDPIRTWCERQGVLSCGHLVYEDGPSHCAHVNGLPLHSLRGFAKPGIDLIHSKTDYGFEWLTLAFAQSAARARGRPGIVELFALGPCDLTFTIMRKLYWLCALHRIDTYFQSIYHQRAYRFNVKDGWAMFSSPTQPWFKEMLLLHGTAREAARWAKKPFKCDIAVVYPQRQAGAESFGVGTGCGKAFAQLCRDLTWNQLTYDLIEEDESTSCAVVIDWDGATPFDRRSGRRFGSPAEAAAWLDGRFAARPRVRDADGKTCAGYVTRAYADGSAVAVNALTGEVIIAPDGVLKPRVESKSMRQVEGDWQLKLSGPSRHRVWFKEQTARIVVREPLANVRFALRRYPEDVRFAVTMDGKPLGFTRPCSSVDAAFDPLYAETDPLTLESGEHVFELSGGRDGKLFLPVLWMIGDFACDASGSFGSVPTTVSLGSLAERGLGSFAGTATWRTQTTFASGERLAIETGGAVARVRLGGRDLGARGWVPFEWEIPDDLANRPLPLEIDVVTSIRPIFGSENESGVKLDHKLWARTSLADTSPVGLVSVRRVAPTSCGAVPLDAAHWENASPLGGDFTNGTYGCSYKGCQWNIPARDVPVSSNIVFSASFAPSGADGASYKTAAVALYETPRRFWHLALLETPTKKRTFELNEMRDGAWCAQGDLKMEIERTLGTWRTGETYRLTIAMGGKGVEGRVTAADGKTVFHRRYRLAGQAVGCGRPVLKGFGIRGTYSAADATWRGELPQAVVREKEGSSTGGSFWRTERDERGYWNFVSPEGKRDFLAGCSTVSWNGDYSFKLGYAPYGRAVREKYGTPAKWARACADRLRSWGFVHVTGDAQFCNETGFSSSRVLGMGTEMSMSADEFCILPCDGGPCTAFPNVFSPKWEQFCRFRAQQTCAPARNDRRLVGWFIDNELAWWGDARKFRTPPARGLYDAALKCPEGHSARAAAVAFAKERGFDDPNAADLETRRAFVALCAERYFSVAAKAIREADPNHLVLGCRFAGIKSCDPVVWEACGRHCDVLSLNLYPVADLLRGAVYNGATPSAPLVEDLLAEVHRKSGKPILITEWSFSALDSGLPCLHGAGQRFLTQKERAQAVGLFAKTMYALPYMAGYLFFKWSDQPAFGRVSELSENTNYGLVNAKDEPYPEVTAVLREIQTDGAKWRRMPPPRGTGRTRTAPGVHARRFCRTSDGAAAFRTEEDGSFVVESGKLRIEGRRGESGLRVGAVARYGLMVREYVSGRMTWTEVAKVEDVRGDVRDGLAVFDVTFGGRSGGVPFRLVERFYLPAGSRCFLAEHRFVENLSDRTLPLDQVFFRLVPIESEGVRAVADRFVPPPKDGQPTPVPPTLWRPWQYGAWVTPSAYCGVATPLWTEVRVKYWKDAGLHTDAVHELGRRIEVAPGVKFEFGDRPYVIGAASSGTESDWNAVLSEIERTAME